MRALDLLAERGAQSVEARCRVVAKIESTSDGYSQHHVAQQDGRSAATLLVSA